MGKGANLAGDHGKTAALLARAGGLDGGVECQDIGLEGNGIDHVDDFANAGRGLGDLIHGGDRTAHGGAATVGRFAGGIGQARGLRCSVGRLAHVDRELG